MIVGGASNDEEAPGLSSGLGLSLIIGEADLLTLPEPPKLNGNAGRENEGMLVLLTVDFSLGTSSSGDAKALRLGLVGFSFGDASFDANRGVNECERAWT